MPHADLCLNQLVDLLPIVRNPGLNLMQMQSVSRDLSNLISTTVSQLSVARQMSQREDLSNMNCHPKALKLEINADSGMSSKTLESSLQYVKRARPDP